jgi:hypothetical protein
MSLSKLNIKAATEAVEILIQKNNGVITDYNGLTNSSRLVKSMKTAKTLLLRSNNLNKKILPGYFVHNALTSDNVSQLMLELESNIERLIENMTQETACDVALAINFWGGSQGILSILRYGNSHFLINKNFDWSIYFQLNKMIQTSNDIGAVLEYSKHFSGLGVSFYTKHLHFLTKNGDIKYPIYDTFISTRYFKKKVHINDYIDYFNWVFELSKKYNVSTHHFERFIFNAVS